MSVTSADSRSKYKPVFETFTTVEELIAGYRKQVLEWWPGKKPSIGVFNGIEQKKSTCNRHFKSKVSSMDVPEQRKKVSSSLFREK